MRDIIQGSTVIQYRTELAAYGYTDITPNDGMGPTAYSRRERLNTHQRNWQELKWTETRLTAEHGTRRQLTEGVYAVQGNPRSLALIQLPSAIRGVAESRSWSHPDLGMETMDFCLDVGQDLLLLIKEANHAFADSLPSSHKLFLPCAKLI